MKRIFITLVFSIALIPASLPGAAFAASGENDTYRQLDLLMEVFERVRAQYVEEVEDEALLEAAIRGMLTELDPHSGYMGPESFRENQIQQRGEYGGLGIEIVPDRGVLRVISPMDDTPAARAGIMPGDYITHIDGAAITGMTPNESVELMRGPPNSPVGITIVREDEAEPLEMTLIREIIAISAVRNRIERGSIGYLRLTTFNNERLSRDLRQKILDMQEEVGADLKGWVIDLRNNPGGLLDQSVEVTDLFLDRGNEITSMRGRNAEDNMRWSARGPDITGGLPIVVLVNAGSASASEIVTGALQDHRRATVIGEQTFGKGVVQTVIPLGRERALRLTTARYYTPAGRSIQAVGIQPDIEVIQPRNGTRRPRREADLDGHITNEDTAATDATEAEISAENVEPLDAETPVDYQLNYALDLLSGVIQMSSAEAVIN
jgi:carboxyl-terminal processing protease